MIRGLGKNCGFCGGIRGVSCSCSAATQTGDTQTRAWIVAGILVLVGIAIGAWLF